MSLLHLHLLSDSTGETLDAVAKAALAQFDGINVVKHFWPMIRSDHHLDRVIAEIAQQPGPMLYTVVNPDIRQHLESHADRLGLPAIAILDGVIDALSRVLNQPARGRPGRKFEMDESYFRRVDAITYTFAQDDGLHAENWEQADIILAGISRCGKTPTSIYLANRGYKVANVPVVRESPPDPALYALQRPLVVGLTANADRLTQVRRNRLLSLNQAPDTSYVDPEQIQQEILFARRLYADHDWPVIDVTRRSIEEIAAAIISLYNMRQADMATP